MVTMMIAVAKDVAVHDYDVEEEEEEEDYETIEGLWCFLPNMGTVSSVHLLHSRCSPRVGQAIRSAGW